MKDDVVHRRAALHASLPIFARRVEIGQPGCIGRPACFLRDVDGSSEFPSHSWVRDLAERGLSKARSNNALVTKAAFQSDPMKEGVRMIRTHLEDIVACAQTRQTNRFLEAINGLLQAANSRARSFIRIETIKTVIFLIAGNLNFHVINPGRTNCGLISSKKRSVVGAGTAALLVYPLLAAGGKFIVLDKVAYLWVNTLFFPQS